MSFMGKGVTKNAVICLLHLSHEMMAENKDKVSQQSFRHRVVWTLIFFFIFSALGLHLPVVSGHR